MDVFQAVRNGEIDNIRRWLDRGGDIQARERGEGYSLVMTAVDAGHLKLPTNCGSGEQHSPRTMPRPF